MLNSLRKANSRFLRLGSYLLVKYCSSILIPFPVAVHVQMAILALTQEHAGLRCSDLRPNPTNPFFYLVEVISWEIIVTIPQVYLKNSQISFVLGYGVYFQRSHFSPEVSSYLDSYFNSFFFKAFFLSSIKYLQILVFIPSVHLLSGVVPLISVIVSKTFLISEHLYLFIISSYCCFILLLFQRFGVHRRINIILFFIISHHWF